MQSVALQTLPIGPLSSKINLSVHSSLPALLAVLALVLTPQEPTNAQEHHHHLYSKPFCHSPQPKEQPRRCKRVMQQAGALLFVCSADNAGIGHEPIEYFFDPGTIATSSMQHS